MLCYESPLFSLRRRKRQILLRSPGVTCVVCISEGCWGPAAPSNTCTVHGAWGKVHEKLCRAE